MRKTARKKIFFFLFTIFCIINAIAIPLIMRTVFPNNEGFTRHATFIHPTNSTDGYFILIDEIHTAKSISFQFHSRGDLIIDESSAKWTQDDISMNCSFYGTSVNIQEAENYLYAAHEKELHEYIQVHPALGTRYLVTIISFSNASLMPVWDIEQSQDEGIFTLKINSTDLFVLNMHSMNIGEEWNYNGFLTDAKFFLYRNSTSSEEEFILTSRSTRFSKNDAVLYSGASNPMVITQNTSHIGFFDGISSSIEYSTPLNLDFYESPGLYFTETELPGIRNKLMFLDSQWYEWYGHLTNTSVLDLAFKARIEENSDYITQTEQILLNLGTIFQDGYQYRQDIDQSTFLIDFIVAYDMIYNNISIQNQDIIGKLLHDLVEPLFSHHMKNVEYWNNHLVVSSIAFGLAGIVLNVPEWVAETQRSIDYYLNINGIRPNGACYEGAHYAYFTFKHAMKFFYALQHNGGYNYYANPRFQAFLNYTVQSMSPTGESPVFEDCQINRTMNIIASLAMSNVQNYNAALAGNLKFLYNRTPPFEYEYVTQLILNHKNVTSLTPYLNGRNQGYIYPSDGYACFRSGWNRSDYYFILSNKNFLQSHVHQDENSFELYAYGKKWMTNPGYPSWGWEGHKYTISAEASNTANIDGKGQFSHLGDGFSSAVQHEMVDYVESPTITTYLHTGYPWRWSGFLLSYGFLIVALIGYIISFQITSRGEKTSPTREFIEDSLDNKAYSNNNTVDLSIIRSINYSIGVWLICIPILTRTRDFLTAHISITDTSINIVYFTLVILSIGITPLLKYKFNLKSKLGLKSQLQLIFQNFLVNIGIGVILVPIMLSAYDKMIYDSGSPLIIGFYFIQFSSKFILIGIVLMCIHFFGKILQIYLNSYDPRTYLLKNYFRKLFLIWILVIYGIISFLAILYRFS